MLWPNAFVKTRTLVRTMKDAIVVPAAAVQQGPSGAYVYVVGDDDTAKMTPVIVALTQGDTSVIAKGLSGGEHVVTEGAKPAPQRRQGLARRQIAWRAAAREVAQRRPTAPARAAAIGHKAL